MFADPLVDKLAAFVRAIGIEVCPATLAEPTILPGLDIRYGAILVDEQRLAYPGDLLHEAGHVAVAPPEQRQQPTLTSTPADEMTAIAWSYAAALELGIDPAIVFHPDGYKGQAGGILQNFVSGNYFGVPMLIRYGMAIEPRSAGDRRDQAYPHMLRWLR